MKSSVCPPERVKAPLLFLDEKTITDYLKTINDDYQDTLKEYCDSIEGDLILLEGAGNLTQGKLFNLSVPEIVEKFQQKFY